MTSVAANPQFASDDELSLKKFLVYSGALHALGALAIAASIYFQFHGNQWAGEGGDLGGTKVNLVSSAGIPMPRPVIPTESQTVDPTQGLNQVEQPQLDQAPVDATKLPTFEKEKPLPPSRKSKVFEKKTPPPKNAVPYGKGGSPDIPTGYSKTPARREAPRLSAKAAAISRPAMAGILPRWYEKSNPIGTRPPLIPPSAPDVARKRRWSSQFFAMARLRIFGSTKRVATAPWIIRGCARF